MTCDPSIAFLGKRKRCHDISATPNKLLKCSLPTLRPIRSLRPIYPEHISITSLPIDEDNVLPKILLADEYLAITSKPDARLVRQFARIRRPLREHDGPSQPQFRSLNTLKSFHMTKSPPAACPDLPKSTTAARQQDNTLQARLTIPPITTTIRPNGNCGNWQFSSSLAPCHICHKSPRLKTDLENFTTCTYCLQRACYVCIRTCESLYHLQQQHHLHSVQCSTRGPKEQTICSRCCVEQGEDGTVVCLTCLAFEEDDVVMDG